MYAEQLVKYPRDKLCYLVKAGCFKIAAVDVLPKAMVLYLVQPAGEVGYETSLSSRQVKDEHKHPQDTEHPAPSLLLGFLRG